MPEDEGAALSTPPLLQPSQAQQPSPARFLGSAHEKTPPPRSTLARGGKAKLRQRLTTLVNPLGNPAAESALTAQTPPGKRVMGNDVRNVVGPVLVHASRKLQLPVCLAHRLAS